MEKKRERNEAAQRKDTTDILKDIKAQGVQIEQISYLNLSGCNITNLDAFEAAGLRSLSFLDLSENRLKDLRGVLDSPAMPVLWAVSAQGNPVSELGGKKRVLGGLDLRNTKAPPTAVENVTCFHLKVKGSPAEGSEDRFFEKIKPLLIVDNAVRTTPAETHHYTKLLKRIHTSYKKAQKHISLSLSWDAGETPCPARLLHSLYTDLYLAQDDDPPSSDPPFFLTGWVVRPVAASDLVMLLSYVLSTPDPAACRAMLHEGIAAIARRHDMYPATATTIPALPPHALAAFRSLLLARLSIAPTPDTQLTLVTYDMLTSYGLPRGSLTRKLREDAAVITRQAKELKTAEHAHTQEAHAERMVKMNYAQEVMIRNERQYSSSKSLRMVKKEKKGRPITANHEQEPAHETHFLSPVAECLQSIPQVPRSHSAGPAPYRKYSKAKRSSRLSLEGFADDETGLLLSAKASHTKHDTLAPTRQPAFGDLVVINDYLGRIAHISAESVVYLQDEGFGTMQRHVKRDDMGRIVLPESQHQKHIPLDLRSPARVRERTPERNTAADEEVSAYSTSPKGGTKYVLVNTNILSWRPRVGWVVLRPTRPSVGERVVEAVTHEQAAVTKVALQEVSIRPLEHVKSEEGEVCLRLHDLAWFPGPHGNTWQYTRPPPVHLAKGNEVRMHLSSSPENVKRASSKGTMESLLEKSGEVVMTPRWSEVRSGNHAFVVKDPQVPWHPFTEESLRRMAVKRQQMDTKADVQGDTIRAGPMACSTAMMGARKSYAAGTTNQFMPSTIRTQVAAFAQLQGRPTFPRPKSATLKPLQKPVVPTPSALTAEALQKGTATVSEILTDHRTPSPAPDPTLFRVKW
eukprot:TRINITY_DN6723_c0_g1_i1.p1 TRINITY_DN6723_c0_g1~~TRINITY_DN6723_c0_g1_i1.p1  ORF type:complete len:858 (+),score=159.04 TRINITY_DN6723_c0_g1_i1:39-2612(+)